jgi:hypothetical protein
MGDTKVVDTPNEIHARLQGLQTHSGMAAAPGQGSQTLSKGGVEPLDKGSVEHGSSLRLGQQVLGPRENPCVMRRVTSTTRLCFVCWLTVAISRSGQTTSARRPRPTVRLTFSRTARRMLAGKPRDDGDNQPGRLAQPFQHGSL